MATTRPLTVRNFGGISQVQVLDDQDLARIDSLDPARWAATSAPLGDLHCDPAFLAYVDADGKGRIRVAQIVDARNWLFDRLANRSRLKERSETLTLADLDQAKEAGKGLKRAADHFLSELGKKGAPALTLGELRAFRASYTQSLANGDGVVCPESVPEPEVAAFMKDAMATVGIAKEVSGRDGLSEGLLQKYTDGAKAYAAWRALPSSDKAIDPWGADTAAAADMVAALDAKIEEYFWVSDLLKQEAVTDEKLRLTGEDWKTFNRKDAATIERYLAESPLAQPTPEGKLPIAGGVNPVYRERFEALAAKVLSKALPKTEKELTRTSWRRVKALFDAHLAWRKAKPAEPYEKLDAAKLAAAQEGTLAARVRHFIGVDLAAKGELAEIAALEKLILYQRWLVELVNNFVNFSAIYHPKETALVEVGTLVIDGRRFEFCVKVQDRGAHKKIASESLIFLIYAEIRDKASDTVAYEVMAPVTAGERGRLRTGKRGIFLDVKGREWDSVIVDVVENPISVIEAMKAPFRRAGAFIGKKVEEFAASQAAASEAKLLAVGTTAPAPAPAPAPGAPPPPAAGVQNMMLVGSIVFAALSTALTFVVSTFAKIGIMDVVAGLLGIVALVAAIAGFLGWLKLRRRDMSLVLEAQGWAVNVEMKLNRRIAGIMTQRPALPAGTITDRTDLLAAYKNDEERAAERRKALIWTTAFVVVAAIVGSWFARPHVPIIDSAWTCVIERIWPAETKKVTETTTETSSEKTSEKTVETTTTTTPTAAPK